MEFKCRTCQLQKNYNHFKYTKKEEVLYFYITKCKECLGVRKYTSINPLEIDFNMYIVKVNKAQKSPKLSVDKVLSECKGEDLNVLKRIKDFINRINDNYGWMEGQIDVYILADLYTLVFGDLSTDLDIYGECLFMWEKLNIYYKKREHLVTNI